MATSSFSVAPPRNEAVSPRQDAMQGRRPSFQMSADARLIYQRLLKATVGETVTYTELSEIVSRKVDGSFAPLHTARKAARRDNQIVFDCIHKVGVKCLSDEDKVKLSDRTATRLRKAARRGIESLGTVHNFNGLSREGQNKHNAALSVFSVVGAVTTGSSIKKIEDAVQKARKELPMTETLKALGLAL